MKKDQFLFQYCEIYISAECTYIYINSGSRSAFLWDSVRLKNICWILVIFYGYFNNKLSFPHFILPTPGTKFLLWEKHILQLNCFTDLLWVRKTMGFSCFFHNVSLHVWWYQPKRHLNC
jgi:hypothetical protein